MNDFELNDFYVWKYEDERDPVIIFSIRDHCVKDQMYRVSTGMTIDQAKEFVKKLTEMIG